MYFNELPIPTDVRWRRLLAVALFLTLLYVFRKLAPVLICFVIFARALGWASDRLFERTRLNRKGAIAGILVLFTGGVGVATVFGIQRGIDFVNMLRTDGGTYVESLTKSGVFSTLRDRLGWDTSAITENAKEVGLKALGYLTEGAYVALFLFVGFILAIIYLFEREDIDEWLHHVDPKSIQGVMTRWLGYVADAIAITVRLQVVVAVVDALLTLPVMIALGLPKIGLLFVLVLVSAMIPVVGGILSGLVLCVVSYDAHGFVGVGVFLVVALVLGKIESYYLAPRLTASHVKLPALVLVVSLLMFEQVFGFWGIFLSFPALYVASKVAAEWKKEDKEHTEIAIAQRTQSVPPSPPTQTPLPLSLVTQTPLAAQAPPPGAGAPRESAPPAQRPAGDGTTGATATPLPRSEPTPAE
jgi:putative permease